MKLRLFAVVMLGLMFGGFALGKTVNAQTPSPTPAPSKTPTPLINGTNTPSPTPTNAATPVDTSLTEPLTQMDLSILSGNIQRPNGLYWYDNKVFTSCSGDWTVYEIDTETGDTAQYIYGVKNSHTLYATSENGELSLWIPDFQSNTLTHIYQGVSENVASNLQAPWGIAPFDADHFAVTNLQGNSLSLISHDGEVRNLITNLKSPTGVATDGDYIYVANTGSARRSIEWFTASDLIEREVALDAVETTAEKSLVSGLQNVTNIVMANDGYLYFAYALGTRGVVGRIQPEQCREQGSCTGDQVEIVLFSELPAPLAGLTISTDMKMYIHTIFSPEIYWVQIGNPESAGS